MKPTQPEDVMIKFSLAVVLALAVSACSSTATPEEQAGSPATIEAATAACAFGYSRCTGQYATGGGACYDPTKANCYGGQVCSFGFKQCVKGSSSSCISVTASC